MAMGLLKLCCGLLTLAPGYLPNKEVNCIS